jgi:hypothetical protein
MDCGSLAELSFERDSKVKKIAPLAFRLCPSLRSIIIPAHLELVHLEAFGGCTSLCELVFEVPSHVKELALPPSEFGSLSIPDSVERILGRIAKIGRQNRVLHFGRDSRLRAIDFALIPQWPLETLIEADADVFLRLPEMLLRGFRCQFERL